MEGNTICFIVLNYQTYSLTRKCVESIMKLETCGYLVKTIIVDNASEDGSGEKLYKEFKSTNNVDVILCEANYGFSEGNNVGYRYAKTMYNPSFVIAANSDVVFNQSNFLTTMLGIYVNTPFWVAGPDIYVKDRSFHQNPSLGYDLFMHTDGYVSRNQAETMKRKWNLELMHMKKMDMYAFSKFIREKYRNSILLQLLLQIKHSLKKYDYYKECQENVCLQGSCLIFDSRYIANTQYLFRPLTFMYMEEQILRLECYCEGRNTLYLPQLKVEHLDCGSSFGNKQRLSEFCKKNEKRLSNMVNACDIYIDYLNTKFGE